MVVRGSALRAFSAWDQFDGHNVRGCLYTITLRLALNRLCPLGASGQSARFQVRF
jgi:hypothetical protein